ncbi:HAD-IC family P-type ATPase [Candidatus Uhrbacteria bacterium]|nr:HAD-IC family P-type ATPase [Candidatus Uhrbacteria bacterium]
MPFSPFTQLSEKDLLIELSVTRRGLSEAEAAKRLAANGPNELTLHRVRPWQILLRQFASPFVYLLLAAAVLAVVLGELIDAIVIAVIVGVNAVLGFVQESRSEQALEKLRNFIISYVRVLRGGEEQTVDRRQIVRGDVAIVETGDIVPADIRLIEAENLVVDESPLTGESVPIHKVGEALSRIETEAYKASNIVFSNTRIMSGRGLGLVIDTGRETVMGSVARLSVETERESTFAQGISRLSAFVLRLILITLAVVFLANLILKQGSVDLFDLLLFSIALAVSVIPEALPVVTTMSLSHGAMELAKKSVVVRRLSAIEDLGSIEVLCSDKTGTLTENHLNVAAVLAKDEEDCLFIAAIASSFLGEKKALPNNSFDLGLWEHLSLAARKELAQYKRSKEIPFDPRTRLNSVTIHGKGRAECIIRGAPEEVMDACGDVTPGKRKEVMAWMALAGRRGERTIAVASTKNEGGKPEFVGAISFVDSLKKSAKQTVREAKELGVQLKILTGDSREVAGAVAHDVGLVATPEEVMTGEELYALSPKEQGRAVKKYHVFARMSPEQKFGAIALLKKTAAVGFLGEGINDAPALKMANVGLVVQGASDVARDAADIVLLKRSLRVIVGGIKEGRSVFSNSLKYIKATLASNFGNFYALVISMFFIDVLPMLPIQILLLNLLTDSPMIAIATDRVEASEVARPRRYNIREIVLATTVLGIVSAAFDLLFFFIYHNHPTEVLQTNWFIGSVLTELVFIFSIRSARPFWRAISPSRPLIGFSLLALTVALIIPFTFPGTMFFRFQSPSIQMMMVNIGVVLAYFVTTELAKLIMGRVSKRFTKQRIAAHA